MDNDFLMSLLPTWHSLIDIHAPELSCPAGADQYPDCFLTPFWDKSTESAGGLMFDSALSSLASSPVSPPPNTSNDGFLIRELMGKPGSSGGLSPHAYNSGHLCKENAPKWGHAASPVNPSLADLEARCVNGRTGQLAEPAAMGKNLKPMLRGRTELSNSQEESSVLNPDKNPGLETGTKPSGEPNRRKRKAAPQGKEAGIEDDSGTKRVQQSDGGNGNENGSVRTEELARGGSEENADGKNEKLQVKKTEAKSPEPPKDYIHVRARRGQATDSHSLAERVRREKISERMKTLQDLVPGCNKVTGKALMLDEIINYVQSLQRQVEFLSMKLSSVNTSMDTNTSTAMGKDVFQPESTDPHQMLPLSLSVLNGQKDPAVNFSSRAVSQYLMDPLNNSQLPPVNRSRASGGDDLHSLVQMGYGQN